MKTFTRFLFLAVPLFATVACVETPRTEPAPSRQSVMEAMETANDYFMSKWPDTKAGIDYPSRNRVYPSNIWTRAVYYEGVMALYAVNQDQKLVDYAVAWGTSHEWDLNQGVTTRNADNQCCGQTYLDLYRMDRQPERIETIKQSIDRMMQSDTINDWDWIDAIQMAMPIFAQLG